MKTDVKNDHPSDHKPKDEPVGIENMKDPKDESRIIDHNDRALREEIRAGHISDEQILSNKPPVPLDEKIAAVQRDEARHGGMSARDRMDHPERVPQARPR